MMNPLENSSDKHLANSAYSSEDQNRSTVKRLYSSVFSIIDNDQDISHFDQLEQFSRIERLVQNSEFMKRLHNKLRVQGLCQGYNLPILRISLFIQQIYPSYSKRQKAQLDKFDIESALHKFGDIYRIIITKDKKDVYVFFNSFVHTYICYKLLNHMNIRGGTIQFNVEWVHNNGYHSQIVQQMNNFLHKLRWDSLYQENISKDQNVTQFYNSEESNNYNTKQNKFTCRYDIQIQNQREFQVARRIIGSKGCNMKRIIQESVSKDTNAYPNDNLNQILKLRLRGKGSGYKEGPQQQESTQNLHLCVSAKDETVYNEACDRVQKLLTSIYSQYYDFTRRQGKLIDLSVKKISIGQFQNNQDGSNYQMSSNRNEYDQSEEIVYQDGQSQMYRISPQKIEELLEMRNKARRQLNFNEADRIRNYLRSCGVCLIDQKGRRGKAAEVTTWKYIY